jgi:hypothetical protein
LFGYCDKYDYLLILVPPNKVWTFKDVFATENIRIKTKNSRTYKDGNDI